MKLTYLVHLATELDAQKNRYGRIKKKVLIIGSKDAHDITSGPIRENSSVNRYMTL